MHVGTNDAVDKPSHVILNDLIKLKQSIELKHTGVEEIIACPIIRTDDSKARVTILKFIDKIKELNVKYLLNDNIGENCLEKKGLHLSQRGVARFAINLINLLRRL